MASLKAFKGTKEEKSAIDRLSVFSLNDIYTQRQLIKTLLSVFVYEFYAYLENETSQGKDTSEGVFTYMIPYIADLEISYKNVVKERAGKKGKTLEVNIKGIPSTSIIQEMSAILEGEKTIDQKSKESNIKLNFQNILMKD